MKPDRNDLRHLLSGFLMGGADIIPGVSGGTVALILGIYRRLVSAISRFDLGLVRHLMRLEIGEAARRVDLRFLALLGTGIATGIVLLAGLMHHLLSDPHLRGFTLAGFFGVILASGVLVSRMVPRWNFGAVGLAAFGFVGTYLLTGLQAAVVDPSLGYIFICGAIAICAMILPGISGAYILLLLGVYLHVTGAIKGIPRGQIAPDQLATVAVFCAGCALGLLGFSKLLRWLLTRFESATMAVLCGVMLGSLRKIWPFQRDLTPQIDEIKAKQFVNRLPDRIDGETILVIGIALGAMAAVFLLDRIARSGRQHPSAGSEFDPR